MANQPPQPDAGGRAPLPAAPVRWQYQPWRQPLRQIGPLFLVATALGLVVWSQFWDGRHAAIVALLVLIAGWRTLFPANYELGSAGVKVETLWRRKRIAWRDLERVVVGRRGLFLVPRGSIWGWWQGLYLPWLDQRAEVLRSLQQQAERFRFPSD